MSQKGQTGSCHTQYGLLLCADLVCGALFLATTGLRPGRLDRAPPPVDRGSVGRKNHKIPIGELSPRRVVCRRHRRQQREPGGECRTECAGKTIPRGFEFAELIQKDEIASRGDVVLHRFGGSNGAGPIEVARGHARIQIVEDGKSCTVREVPQKPAWQTAREAAEAANRTKSQFLANMSHELRPPLNAIIGFADMLERGFAGPVQPKQEEYARLIKESGEHLTAVVNDILDVAKVGAGRLELREESGIEPRRVINDCVRLMADHPRAGAVRLSTEVEDDVPTVVADPVRLKQILVNLMSNAIKFTEAGGSAAIAVRRRRDGSVVFEVRATGPGMTPKEIDTALEPFGQLDGSYARKHEGAGLGLPLARRLAELHGWSLHLNSKKGRALSQR